MEKTAVTNLGRIKVIKETENIMDWVCICPHCGKETTYGKMIMTNGIHNCEKCNTQLNKQIETDRDADYETYSRKANNHEYEPYMYVEEDDKDYLYDLHPMGHLAED